MISRTTLEKNERGMIVNEGRKMTIKYYAFAGNKKGKIEQLIVTRKNGKPKTQKWTGVIYKTIKEACADMERLNC